VIDFYDKKLKDFLVFWPAMNPNDPSPAEIARICKEIQATWTPSTRESRRVYSKYPATTAQIRCQEDWIEEAY